jgi:rhodanese-related sulfurtransferase
MTQSNRESDAPYATISAEEAREKIENGVRLIDVRRPDEWARGHVAQAELLTITGIYDFGKALIDLQLPPDQEVIFMCAAGQRSAMASEIAALIGLDKIYNLEDGINGWVYHGYPVER